MSRPYPPLFPDHPVGLRTFAKLETTELVVIPPEKWEWCKEQTSNVARKCVLDCWVPW